MVQQINEPMEFLDGLANVTITIHNEDATITIGGNGKGGTLQVRDSAGNPILSVNAGTGSVEVLDAAGNGAITLETTTGDMLVTRQVAGSSREVLRLDASAGTLHLGDADVGGNLVVRDGAGRTVAQIVSASAALYLGAEGNEGDLIVRDGAGQDVFHFNAENAALYLGAQGNEGDIIIRNNNGANTFQVDGNEGDIIVWRQIGRTTREVLRFDASNAALYIGSEGNEGDIIVRDGRGRQVFHFDSNYAALYLGASGNEGDLILRNNAGDDTVKIDGGEGDLLVWRKINGVNREVLRFDASHAALYIGSEGNEGDIIVRDGANREVFHFDSNYAALYVGANGNEGDVIVRDGDGNERIRLDGGSGDVILTGADCAEDFCVSTEVEPGTIMVIENDESLRPCDQAYDRRVAGVISGAGGLNPGITLGKRHDAAQRVPLALAGRAYCKVDADIAPVEIGDLLTTSATPGHAMKAQDTGLAFGAVIGKALRPLKRGKGLVPVLIALQ